MRIEENILVFDGNNNHLYTIVKSVPGLCSLVLPYVTTYGNDLSASMLLTVLYKTIIDSVYLENFRSDPTVDNFFNLIEKNYIYYAKEFPANVKMYKLLVDKYRIITTYSFSELQKMEDFDIKLFNLYILDKDTEEKYLVYSYPLVEEILPIIYNDMITTYNVRECALFGEYSIKLIAELKKQNKLHTKGSFDIIQMITNEFLETEEFLEDNIPDYEKNRLELLSNTSYIVESQPTIYNNPTMLVNYIFDFFLSSKNKDFFEDLNDLFNKYLSGNRTENYKKIVLEFNLYLYNKGFINISECVKNIMNNEQAESLVNLLYIKLYKIYGTEDYHKIFDNRDDNSRGNH